MGAVFWIVVAGVGIAGYFGYRKLTAVERELREELAAEREEGAQEEMAGEEAGEEQGSEEVAAEKPRGGFTLEERLLDRIRERPGILQTELYALEPEESRRALQDVLRRLDQQGRVARTRERGTYRLYPVQ